MNPRTDVERAGDRDCPEEAGPGMNRIASWVEPEQIVYDAPLGNRRQALELASVAIGRMHQLDATPIVRALWRRELVGSTALGEGVAIPHARIDGIDHPVTLFIRTEAPIEFEAPDGKPVANILVILVPADGDTDDHLQLLALIAQMFCDRDFRMRLCAATDAESARCAFADYVRQSPHNSTEAPAAGRPAGSRDAGEAGG
jgi:PTS system nitrogen regulatory IIA component